MRARSLPTTWTERARHLKTEVYALYIAYRDPRVPWYAKVFAACVVGYALSPIDLIPDPIPVLGHLDDLILVPLGLLIARRLIPAPVLAECRERARLLTQDGLPINRVAAVIVVVIWVLAAVGTAWFLIRVLRSGR